MVKDRSVRLELPEHACDCHIHVLDSAPMVIDGVPRHFDASWTKYHAEASAIGLKRAVIVQPSFYRYDNSFLMTTLQKVGGHARGVVVIEQNISEAALDSYHKMGVRGVRFNTVSGGLELAQLERISDRIRPYGWHIQLYIDSSSLVDMMPRLLDLGVDCVLDHMAHVSESSTTADPGFRVLLDGLQTGKIWVKLSNALFKPDINRAKRLIQANADRMVWGSDWPHVIYRGKSDSLEVLLQHFQTYSNQYEMTEKILVDNPNKLYFS